MIRQWSRDWKTESSGFKDCSSSVSFHTCRAWAGRGPVQGTSVRDWGNAEKDFSTWGYYYHLHCVNRQTVWNLLGYLWDTFGNQFPEAPLCSSVSLHPTFVESCLQMKTPVYFPTEHNHLKRGLPKGNYGTGNIRGQKCKASGAWGKKKKTQQHDISQTTHWSYTVIKDEAKRIWVRKPEAARTGQPLYPSAPPRPSQLITPQTSRRPSASLSLHVTW